MIYVFMTCYNTHIAPYPITRQQILDWSKLKQLADNNFEFDENSRKFFKWVENTG